MKPQVAEFTKDRPATKLDIWNTFRGRRGFRSVQVDEAKAQIGANAPRYWVKKGWMVEQENARGGLVYALTDSGKAHMLKGMESYLKNHPDHRSRAVRLPAALQ